MTKLIMIAGMMLAALYAHPTTANSVPHYDVKAACHYATTAPDRADHELNMAGCFMMEEMAHENLVKRWTALAQNVRLDCEEIASASGPASYSLLLGCVEMETTSVRAEAPIDTGFRADFESGEGE